ncbi:MAG: hypothetical protein J0L55_02310 [Caulobacterales bacterium]|nr:hypothetical protein [Caulobacterales bacterium]MCA0372164.1 hypothetical protein [Pseudomonadota bacterium]
MDKLINNNVTAIVRDEVRVGDNMLPTIGGEVFVEVANEKGEIATLSRQVNPDFDNQIVVYPSNLDNFSNTEGRKLFLGRDSYKSELGFHHFLSNFIGFPYIEVLGNDDGNMRLYLDYVFSLIFLEQKRGWTDIMSNQPFYGMRDSKRTTISEVIGLEFVSRTLKKTQLGFEKLRLKNTYETQLDALSNYLILKHLRVSGAPRDLVNRDWDAKLVEATNMPNRLTAAEMLVKLQSELDKKLGFVSINPSDDGTHSRINEISSEIAETSRALERSTQNISIKSDLIETYRRRLDAFGVELKKNKEEKRIKTIATKLVGDLCPTCEQPIDGTLAFKGDSFVPMTIDENIQYIFQQSNILKNLISLEESSLKDMVGDLNKERAFINDRIEKHSSLLRSLKTFIEPSIFVLAKEIAQLEAEVSSLEDVIEYANKSLGVLKNTSNEYFSKLDAFNKLKGAISEKDLSKIYKLQNFFHMCLSVVGFDSYEVDAVIIDKDTFQPKVLIKKSDGMRKVKPEFGSSASDWIRIIIAFTIALQMLYNDGDVGVHPGVSIFDEPKQQNIEGLGYLEIYRLAVQATSEKGQIIIAATDKDGAVRKITKDLNINLVDFGEKYVLQLEND